MFERDKKIEEYMRISNNVKIPGEKEKVIVLNERRKKGMNRKAIMSVAMAIVIGGVVVFTNIGSGLQPVSDVQPIKVFASENGSNKSVELKKGTKTEITGGFKVFGEDIDGNVMFAGEGINFDINSTGLESVKVKANKGGFTKFTSSMVGENLETFESEEGEIGETARKGEKVIEKERIGERFKQYPETPKELVLDKLNGKASIEYCYSKEMAEAIRNGKPKDEVIKEVEIEIEATHKGGEVTKNKLMLSADKNGDIVAELK